MTWRASATTVAKKAKHRNVGPLLNRESDLMALAQRRLRYSMPSLSQSSSTRSFRALGTEENYQQEEWCWLRDCLRHLFKSMRLNSCIQECHKSWAMSSHHHSLIFSKDCGGPGISLTTKDKGEGPPISTERELRTSLVCVAGKLDTPGINWNKRDQVRCKEGENCHEDSLAVEQAVQEALQALSWELSSPNQTQPWAAWSGLGVTLLWASQGHAQPELCSVPMLSWIE